MINILHLLSTYYVPAGSVNYFRCIIPFIPSNSPLWKDLLLLPFYRWKTEAGELDTQLGSGPGLTTKTEQPNGVVVSGHKHLERQVTGLVLIIKMRRGVIHRATGQVIVTVHFQPGGHHAKREEVCWARGGKEEE